MKARIPPQKRLSRETLKACAEYANSLQDANNVRIFKLSCRVLHEYFGFGAQRITKYVNIGYASAYGEWKKRNGL